MSADKEVKVIVRRGTNQIGGCCTTISYDNFFIAIDYGSPLDAQENKTLIVSGMTEGEVQCKGLFFTHYHGDHIGEADKVLHGVPMYMGECAKKIVVAYQNHMGSYSPYFFSEHRLYTIEAEKPLVIDDFTIAAIASDHSSVGTLMYLIEVGGKRILHTGDFRLHGLRKNLLLEKISHIKEIDLLITEGTTLSRLGQNKWGEEKVGEELVRMYNSYKYCFVLTSSTNLDRLQVISENVPRGKYFLVNSFQKELMQIAKDYAECKFNKTLIYRKNLDERIETRGFAMVIGTNQHDVNLMKYYFEKYPNETCLVYSMWNGYKELENVKKLCNIAGKNLFHVHSSGHVVLQDLNTFIDMINPKKMIIIHTDSDDRKQICYKERIIKIKDNEEIVV